MFGERGLLHGKVQCRDLNGLVLLMDVHVESFSVVALKPIEYPKVTMED